MKPIKFRAWDKEENKMLGVFELKDIPCGFDDNISICSKLPNVYEWKDRILFLQFTGLLDKNGKEIYEGDIVDWKGKKEVVEWHARGCWYPFIYVEGGVNEHLDQAFSSDMKVIGNIYETPALLTNIIK